MAKKRKYVTKSGGDTQKTTYKEKRSGRYKRKDVTTSASGKKMVRKSKSTRKGTIKTKTRRTKK